MSPDCVLSAKAVYKDHPDPREKQASVCSHYLWFLTFRIPGAADPKRSWVPTNTYVPSPSCLIIRGIYSRPWEMARKWGVTTFHPHLRKVGRCWNPGPRNMSSCRRSHWPASQGFGWENGLSEKQLPLLRLWVRQLSTHSCEWIGPHGMMEDLLFIYQSFKCP